MFLKGQHNTDIGHHYLMQGLTETSKTQFVILSSTAYRKSTICMNQLTNEKKIKFLAFTPFSGAKKHVPESIFISVMCFFTSFALLTEPNHDVS